MTGIHAYSLYSGSTGNAFLLDANGVCILIDAGKSAKSLCAAIRASGHEPEDISAVFLTHEHSDHIKGLRTLTTRFEIPVYAQELNAQYLCENGFIGKKSECFVIDSQTQVAGFSVKAFSTPHDTRQSCGYRIETPDGRTVSVCTDLGEVTDTVHENLLHSDLVLLEANYDYNMLRNGPYPYPLKQRIASSHGHLDNRDCTRELSELIKTGTTRIIIGHLSLHNNRPQIAEDTVINGLCDMKRNMDYILLTAPTETGGEVVIV